MLAIQMAFCLVIPATADKIYLLIGATELTREVFNAVFYVIMFTVPLCVFYILRTLIVKEPLAKNETKLPLKYGVYTFFAAFMLIFMLGNVYFALFPNAGAARYYVSDAGVWSNLLRLLISVLVPVVIEEIMFRRLILNELSLFGGYPAILFSSMLFALMYYDIEKFPYAFVVGVAVGWVYTKKRSVVHTILIRAASEVMLFILHAARTELPEKNYLITVAVIFTVAMTAGLFSFIKLASDKGFDMFSVNRRTLVPVAEFFTWPMTVYLAAATAIAWTRAFL